MSFAMYDFSKGKRGKYAAKYARGTNIVRLEPDVADTVRLNVLIAEVYEHVRDLVDVHGQSDSAVLETLVPYNTVVFNPHL